MPFLWLCTQEGRHLQSESARRTYVKHNKRHLHTPDIVTERGRKREGERGRWLTCMGQSHVKCEIGVLAWC